MTLEQLMAMGMAEEVAKKVLEAHQTALKGYVPKATYDEAVTAKTNAEGLVKERDKQLEDLKKVDAAGLKAEIEKLQGENKTAKEKYDADLKDVKLTNALKFALAGKVHDPEIVISLLDKSKVVLDEKDNVKSGLDEQLKPLEESKGFLFTEKKKEDPKFKGIKPIEGKDNDGNPISVGASFAKVANESGKAPEGAPNYWPA